MRKITSLLTAVLFVMLSLSPALVHADEAVATAKDLDQVNSQLRDQITDLQNRLKDLEGRLSNAEKRPAAPTYVPAPSAGSGDGGMIRTLEDINMSGFIDTTYNLNTNRPQKGTTALGTNNGNNLRVFDTRDNNFDLNAFELDFEKLAPVEGGVGFRADLQYGLNSIVTDGGGANFDGAPGVGPDEFDLQQAYGEVNIPINGGSLLGEKVNIKAGKFVTLAGAEVIESKDNWNISRSMAFGFGIPFTHTGIRSAVDVADGQGTLTLGLNNGWDVVAETNNYKTLEGAFSWKLSDNLTALTANYLGKEGQTNPNTAEISDDMRFVSSNVLTWKTPIEKLTMMANWDIGNQSRAQNITAGTNIPKFNEAEDQDNAMWHSYNLYAKYDLSEKMYLAYRGELFEDNDSFRTFGTTTPVKARRFWGNTFTLDYRPYTNLIARLEYRHDTSNAGLYDVSTGGSTEGQASQSTFGSELIFLF